MSNVLLLGGTGEARALAELLHARGVRFTSSLAGRVARPRLPVGPVRIGGFGGVEGLVAYLRTEEVTAVVDATHPFAEEPRHSAPDGVCRRPARRPAGDRAVARCRAPRERVGDGHLPAAT